MNRDRDTIKRDKESILNKVSTKIKIPTERDKTYGKKYLRAQSKTKRKTVSNVFCPDFDECVFFLQLKRDGQNKIPKTAFSFLSFV